MNLEIAFRLVAATPWLAALCAYDMRHRRLPNGLTLGGLAVALLYCLCWGGPVMLADGLLAAFFSALFLILPFFLHAAGGGDVKMLAASGAIVGLHDVVKLLFAVSLSGFALAIVMWCMGRVDASRLKHYFRVLFDFRYDRKAGKASLPPRSSERCRVPFGVAIAAGTWLTLLWMLIDGGHA